MEIYQQEKDWNNAILSAKHLESASGEKHNQLIAQYYCEIASQHIASGKIKEAKENLRKALNTDLRCVRASILEAELLQSEEKYKSALKAYKRIEKQDTNYIAEIIEPMIICYRKLGLPHEAIRYLKETHRRYRGITSMLNLTELIVEQEGEEEGIKFISGELRKRPTVRGVNRLLEHTMGKAEGEIKENLITIKELTEKLLENKTVYKCHQCGFDAKSLHWQCLGCKNWNTIKPAIGSEGE